MTRRLPRHVGPLWEPPEALEGGPRARPPVPPHAQDRGAHLAPAGHTQRVLGTPQADKGEKGRRVWGWHSPDGLQAALDGLWRDEAAGRVVDLVGQAEAHLQPAVDVV